MARWDFGDKTPGINWILNGVVEALPHMERARPGPAPEYLFGCARLTRTIKHPQARTARSG